jgi:hypothetical protein
VRTCAPSGTTVDPCTPIALQLATSSSWIARASFSSRDAISSGDPPACAASANTRFIRSIAQKRLTAVGRVAAIRSHIF